MILYKGNTTEFEYDVRYNKIVAKLEQEYLKAVGRHVSPSEKRSWSSSLHYMANVVVNTELNHKDCGVLIEYQLPSTSQRLDFLITGQDKFFNRNAVIVELKQWDKVWPAETSRQVVTYVGNANREVSHPAVQVDHYRQYLLDYHTAFSEDVGKAINLYACSYLHNYQAEDKSVDELFNPKFHPYIVSNPVFTKNDVVSLGEYLKAHVKEGNGIDIVNRIEKAEIKPSKKLIEHVKNILDHKKEFTLLDDQIDVFDKVTYLCENYDFENSSQYTAVIIKGGPGTGKSVVGITLLSHILSSGIDCIYLAANAAFKNGMAQQIDPKRAKRLFMHPYIYCKTLNQSQKVYQTAIIDEAHRLSNTPPPMNKKLDDSIVKEIMKRTKLSVFFVDDNQMIRPSDIGSYEYIKSCAKELGSEIHEYELKAQFRCAGSEGYINWLDDVLDIRQTANASGWENLNDLTFQVMDDPNQVRDRLFELHQRGYNCRMLAGYAWDWSEELNSDGTLKNDVTVYQNGKLIFEMPWNPRDSYSTPRAKGIPKSGADWVTNRDGIAQIGCIHTCQGLEFDYVGVIIGKEFKYDPDSQQWIADVNEIKDSKITKKHAKEFLRLARNTYKTLLTRGTKGVFVYSVDEATQNYLDQRYQVIREKNQNFFYRKKLLTYVDLFRKNKEEDSYRPAAEDELQVERSTKTIIIDHFRLVPYKNDFYFCDIDDEKIFLQRLAIFKDTKDKEISIKQELEDDLSIRSYFSSKEDLILNTGLMRITPLVFVYRYDGRGEVLSCIFTPS